MNGIVANSIFPAVRRLVRGLIVLSSCVLSASLIGAVHTKPFITDHVAPVEDPADASNAVDGEAFQAAYRVPVQKTLSATTPVPSAPQVSLPLPAGRELLQDIKTIIA